ncbi:MAG: YlxM family DNA-binding protein [Vallitaleaceae bacterium]|nr:YlxM family DNA-binding protein [Vallitaleaceae bacterium]
MDEITKRNYLYDFYGALLTERQKEVYEDYVLNDLSLGEIAEELSISRAAVHDMIKRSDKILDNYEQKLHLMERYLENKALMERIRDLTRLEDQQEALIRIRQQIDDFLEKL